MVTIIHSAKHLKSGKTTIEFERDGDNDTKESEKKLHMDFHHKMQAMIPHAAIADFVVTENDYDTSEQPIDVPGKKDQTITVPELTDNFDITITSMHLNKGQVKLGYTYVHKYGTSTRLTPNINISFESESGYPFVDHLSHLVKEFEKECIAFIDGKVDPNQPAPKEAPKPELPFDATNAKDRESSTKIHVLAPEKPEESWEMIQDRKAKEALSKKRGKQTPENPGGVPQ